MKRFDDDLWSSHRLESRRAQKRAENRRAADRRNPARRAERAVRTDAKPFIAIDSEGGSFGEPFTLDDGRVNQPHKSFLWGAAGADGEPGSTGEAAWLYSPTPLKSIAIIDFLLAQKAANPTAIFISFAFGYDVCQLLADMRYDKAWELQRGRPFDKPDERVNNTRRVGFTPPRPSRQMPNLDREYGARSGEGDDYWIQYIKGKWITIGKGWRKGSPSIKIYDVFGFFQCSFIAAAGEIPGAASNAEMEIIKTGKAKRGEFDHALLDEMKNYTATELKVLCRMMDSLREKFLGQEIRLQSWNGAGSIASALAKREQVKPHIAGSKAVDPEEWQVWAHHAFAGGRIELIQQGATHDRLFVYDIASAYPHEISALSSMEGGTWVRGSDKPSDIRQQDRLSIVRLRAKFVPGFPFYPLFYRTPQGRIYFPQEVYGTYMQAEAVAAFDFVAEFGGTIEVEGVWEFIPASKVKPYNFIRQLFDYRAKLVSDHKAGNAYDLTEKVLKLGMNSCYGKTAQKVGTFGKSPALACPWYAAAITAGTRARMFRAAMRAHEDVVMFATDGIVSRRPLPVEVPVRKTLGEWECSEKPLGGVFVHSGVYSYFGSTSGKTRGFRPDDVSGSTTEIIQKIIPEKWKKGDPSFAFTIKLYATLGLSTITREAWERAGSWITAKRELKLNSAGAKRVLDLNAKSMRDRGRRLQPTIPADISFFFIDTCGKLPLSYISLPEWLDHDFGEGVSDDEEQSDIECGFLPY